ncbi:hypothetical protein, partial [uncultured Xanthomonas sp.]|uniref:hypothetical protein n=1 Tax=uncultured Xanthomonas sp. TaxID=152831 RepID=UPI0025FAA7A5
MKQAMCGSAVGAGGGVSAIGPGVWRRLKAKAVHLLASTGSPRLPVSSRSFAIGAHRGGARRSPSPARKYAGSGALP